MLPLLLIVARPNRSNFTIGPCRLALSNHRFVVKVEQIVRVSIWSI